MATHLRTIKIVGMGPVEASIVSPMDAAGQNEMWGGGGGGGVLKVGGEVGWAKKNKRWLFT